jgi:flagellar hook-associated protein 1 FlgK
VSQRTAFAVPGGDYSLLTAGNFSLSNEVLTDVFNIAASDTLIDLSQSNTQQGNNKNVLAMLELAASTSLSGIGSFENYLKSAVAEIAIESRHCQDMGSSQTTIVDNLMTRREGVSGVSIDEEMTEMVRCQHAYAASSRMFNAIDEQLDILINKTGIVGR